VFGKGGRHKRGRVKDRNILRVRKKIEVGRIKWEGIEG
jgi:hypothetical protein